METMKEAKCWKAEYAVHSFFQTDIFFRTVIVCETEEQVRPLVLKGNRLAEKITVLPASSVAEAMAWRNQK